MDNFVSNITKAGSYIGIQNRICELNYPVTSDINLKGRFFYLSFKNQKPSEEEFAKFIYDKIINYCIPIKKRKYNETKYYETGEYRYINDMHDQAKHLFVKSLKERGAQLGEPGELIMFILLEAFLDAPQISCKMFLKTSEKMPVHGSDGIHIKYNPEDDSLTVYWGESKLYKDLPHALDKICESISSFNDTDKDGRTPRDRDIDIIKDYPNVEDASAKEALLNYFDPYSEQSNKVKEVFCCMAGFDYELYYSLVGTNDEDVEQYFRKKYVDRIRTCCSLFSDKIVKSGLQDLEFTLLLLPFKSVENFRTLFFNNLGLEDLNLLEENKNGND